MKYVYGLGGAWLLGVVFSVIAFPVSGQDVSVIQLRASKVTLFERKGGDGATRYEKVRDVSKDEFVGPWPVRSTDGPRLEVVVDGKSYWVWGYAVQTNHSYRVPAECGAVVARSAPKYGSTRGLGEECVK